ncbi:MAG: sigma-70 family RNA polymerase sigma factor [Nitrolancea sp.]
MPRELTEPDRTGIESLGNEAALVQAAKVDGEAFSRLYRHYRLPIYRYCRARSRTDEDAADLAQQVFLRAFEALPRYEERGFPFGAWLYRLAHNAVIDAARRPERTLPMEQVLTPRERHLPNEPESSALEADSLLRFQQLIAPLTEERRHLLTLRFVLELPTAEIAGILGKRDTAIRSQLKRALASLKEQQHGR